MRSGPNRAKPWRVVLWASSLPALLAASFFYFPYCRTGPVVCPFPLILGLPCPGCGITRALCYATHGQFREAFSYHAIWPLLLGYLVFLWIYKIVETVRGQPPKLPTYRIGGGAILVLLGFWVIRLIWFFNHDGLATMVHDNGIARLIRVFS